jgi:hypothetical protein
MGINVQPTDPTTRPKLDPSCEFWTKFDLELEPGPTYPSGDKTTTAWALTSTTYYYYST